MNGYIKINIGGKERGFKFSMYYALRFICIELNCSIVDLAEAGKKDPIGYMVAVLYYGHKYNEEKAKRVIDFDILDFYEWIEEAGGIQSPVISQIHQVFSDSINKDVPTEDKADSKKKQKVI